MAVFLLPLSLAYGFSNMGEDCSKCHTLTKEDAAALLKDFGQNLNILDVKASPLKGMWEVDIDTGGKKGLAYIDFSKKYLFTGAIIDIKGKRNFSQERMVDLNRVDVSQIPLDDALILGDKGAKYKIIVFDDPD